jgi:hypothetical protein
MSAFEADRFNHSRTSPEKNGDQFQSGDNSDLTTAPEELLQNLGRSSCQNASANLHLMIRAGMINHRKNGMDRSRFRIIRTIHQASYSRVNQGARAHGAGLNCNKQIAVDQAVVTQVLTCFAHSDHLGMGGWIVVLDVAIRAARHNASLIDDNSADGNFPGFERTLSGAKRLFHPEFV